MSPVVKEVATIVGKTLFYFLLIVLIMLTWEGHGLFIYENF